MDEDLDIDLDQIAKDELGEWLKWPGPHTVRFTGKMLRRVRHWINNLPEDCVPGCTICPTVVPGDGREAKRTYAYDVEMADGNVAKLELSATAQRALSPIMHALRDTIGAKWKDRFIKQWYRAERKGSGKGTKYIFTPVDAPERKPSDEIPF